MNQTWENDKKPNFGPDFDSFGPKLLEAISVCNFKKGYWTKLEQI